MIQKLQTLPNKKYNLNSKEELNFIFEKTGISLNISNNSDEFIVASCEGENSEKWYLPFLGYGDNNLDIESREDDCYSQLMEFPIMELQDILHYAKQHWAFAQTKGQYLQTTAKRTLKNGFCLEKEHNFVSQGLKVVETLKLYPNSSLEDFGDFGDFDFQNLNFEIMEKKDLPPKIGETKDLNLCCSETTLFEIENQTDLKFVQIGTQITTRSNTGKTTRIRFANEGNLYASDRPKLFAYID